MRPSESAPIDRVHGVVNVLRERAEALIEKAEDGPPGLWVWRKAADPQDSRRQFTNAYDAFVDGLDTMKAARNDLDKQGYEDRDFSFLDAAGKEHFHAAGIQSLYLSVVKARHTWLSGSPNGVAELLRSLGPLEQVLLKARKWLKARKRSADKTAVLHQKPLTEDHQKAFDLICKDGPLTGKEVVNRLGLSSQSLFTSKYVPELKKHGIENRRGLGYYHPDSYKPGPKAVAKG